MSGTYEIVIKNTKKIESLLEEKLGAEGRGLHTKAKSVENILEQKIFKKIHYIATIRNNLMHEDGFEIQDIASFEEECKNVIHYLSTKEFKASIFSKKFNSKDSLLKKILSVFGMPILFFACGVMFTPLILILSSKNIDVPLINILFNSLVQGFAFSGIYWGYSYFTGRNLLLKLVMFPFVMIGGMLVSPVKIYQGIQLIRA